MNASNRAAGCCAPIVAVAVSGLAFMVAPAAQTTPWAAERIAVHAEYGVYGGRAYLDIDELATALREAHPVTLEVIACGPAAVDAFIRAVPYFSAFALVPQVADAGHLACLTPALLRIAQGSQPFATKGEVAAAKYWSEVAP